jgi:hypothetical protein
VVSDRKLCQSAAAAATAISDTVYKPLRAGEDVPTATIRAGWKKYGRAMTSAAATGGPTRIATTMTKLGRLGTGFATATDPLSAAISSQPFLDGNETLETACDALGVTLPRQ